MARKNKNLKFAAKVDNGSSPAGVARMVAHAASGAAGVHEDQNARRRNAAGRTNRVGSRSAQKRAVLRDWS